MRAKHLIVILLIVMALVLIWPAIESGFQSIFANMLNTATDNIFDVNAMYTNPF